MLTPAYHMLKRVPIPVLSPQRNANHGTGFGETSTRRERERHVATTRVQEAMGEDRSHLSHRRRVLLLQDTWAVKQKARG